MRASKEADADLSSGSSKQMMRWVFDDSDVEDTDFDGLFLDDDDGDGGQFSAVNGYDDDFGPNVILNDEDLFMLHNIDIPGLTKPPNATRNENGGVAPSTWSKQRLGAKGSTDMGASQSTVSLDVTSSNLSYFYLRDGLGLSEDVMWKITTKAPSVLGFKAANIREKVRVLKSIVGLTDDELRQLVTSQPTLLQLSAKKNIAPTILFLLRQLDLGKKELTSLIMGCPTLLKYSIGNLNGKLVFFQETMGYSVSECRNLLLSDPLLLTCSVETGLVPRLLFLHKEVEIPMPYLRTIIRKNPGILKMSVDENLQPKLIFYFIMTLRMTPDQVGKLLLKYPQILNFNLDNHIRPIHEYFLSLDFSTQEFGRIVQRFPRLISYSLARIKQRIGFLRFELYLEAHSVRRIMHQNPQLVGLTQQHIKRSVEYVLDVVAPGATLSDNSVADDGGHDAYSDNGLKDSDIPLIIVQTMVAGLPSLLNLNIETNLQPKVEYLRRSLGQQELSHALMRMPTLLGYSLENRIRPRMEQILAAGVEGGKITSGIPMKDEVFVRWLERSAKKKGAGTGVQIQVSNATTITTQQTSLFQETPVGTTTGEAHVIESGSNEDGNGRVVEEGGRIMHWRRPR
jgi:mTERF domain-containing protein